jgi:hypothetical protein
MNNLHQDYLTKDMGAFAVMLSLTSLFTYVVAGVGYYIFMVRAENEEASQNRTAPTNNSRSSTTTILEIKPSYWELMFPSLASWKQKSKTLISRKKQDLPAREKNENARMFSPLKSKPTEKVAETGGHERWSMEPGIGGSGIPQVLADDIV